MVKDEFAVSLDLSDAYLHVRMHRTSQKFLRFALLDEGYAFLALPFGLYISPWVFTWILDEVLAVASQRMEPSVSNFLDDLLLKNIERHHLELDLQFFLAFLRSLGFMVNLDKSDLIHSQSFTHLGMTFDTVNYSVSLPEKRRVKLVSAVTELLSCNLTSRRNIAQVVGQCSAAADLLPLGEFICEPLQFAAADVAKNGNLRWDTTVPVTTELRSALLPWTNATWLQTSVPIKDGLAQMTLCVDASQAGWGAHLLPDFVTCAGSWRNSEVNCHINELELLAVLKSVMHWMDRLRGKTILVMSDCYSRSVQADLQPLYPGYRSSVIRHTIQLQSRKSKDTLTKFSLDIVLDFLNRSPFEPLTRATRLNLPGKLPSSLR